MKIAVMLKQVPLKAAGMDMVRGVILRGQTEKTLNPFDKPALEAALRLREESCSLDVYTMGPSSAANVLKSAFELGADRSFLLCDARFSGADTYATSYALAQAAKLNGGYDLIVCGDRTTDGSTGQCPASLAAHLNIPFCGQVVSIESLHRDSVELTRSSGGKNITISLRLPCVISVAEGKYELRLPSLKSKLAAAKKEYTLLTPDMFGDADPSHYGQSGSFTRVAKVYPARQTKQSAAKKLSPHEASALIVGEAARVKGGAL